MSPLQLEARRSGCHVIMSRWCAIPSQNTITRETRSGTRYGRHFLKKFVLQGRATRRQRMETESDMQWIQWCDGPLCTKWNRCIAHEREARGGQHTQIDRHPQSMLWHGTHKALSFQSRQNTLETSIERSQFRYQPHATTPFGPAPNDARDSAWAPLSTCSVSCRM